MLLKCDAWLSHLAESLAGIAIVPSPFVSSSLFGTNWRRICHTLCSHNSFIIDNVYFINPGFHLGRYSQINYGFCFVSINYSCLGLRLFKSEKENTCLFMIEPSEDSWCMDLEDKTQGPPLNKGIKASL